MTGGSPARNASSRRIASAPTPTTRPAVGSSTVGSAPPPTCARSSTTLARSRSRSAGDSRRSARRARLRTAAIGSVSIRNVGTVSKAEPASYAYSVASRAAIVNLSIRSARFQGFFLSRETTARRPTTIPAWGPPRSLSPENDTRSTPEATASCTVGSCGKPHGRRSTSDPEPRSSMTGIPRSRPSSTSSPDDTSAVKPTTR